MATRTPYREQTPRNGRTTGNGARRHWVPRPADARPPAGSNAGWRETVAAISSLNLIAGIWLIIAPWVLGYTAGDPKWNDVVFGAIIAGLALLRTVGIRPTAWASAVNMVIGAWLFASAFWLDSSTQATTNDIILGIVVFVLAAASMSATPVAPERHDVANT